jgi:hypothetical protein
MNMIQILHRITQSLLGQNIGIGRRCLKLIPIYIINYVYTMLLNQSYKN